MPKHAYASSGGGASRKILAALQSASDASSFSLTLLTNDDETGAPRAWTGGKGLWSVWGTWNGATAALHYSPDGGTTFMAIEGASLTQNGALVLDLPADQLKVVITGAGGGTSLSSKINRS